MEFYYYLFYWQFDKALYDLGVNINLMPLYVFRKLSMHESNPNIVSLQVANKTTTYSKLWSMMY